MWVAGVDGCRGGWFRVCRDTGSGALAFDLLQSVSALVERSPGPAIVGLDMPIGLPAAGRREADTTARRCLGPRRSSVFPAPVRAALRARTREEASDITERRDGRKVGPHAWGLYAKIRSLDEALAKNASARSRIREVHPELCFWAWNSGAPMKWAKRTPQGLAERVTLAEAWLGAGILERARGSHRKKVLADDDVVDAIAALWTAHRIAAGVAKTLPDSPPHDETGLPMEIVY